MTKTLKLAAVVLLGWLTGGTAAQAACGEHGVAVQVLGSGGPIADDARASAGYLLWIDGHARLMVDTGGGTFLRYGEAGAHIEDLDLVALTHLHTDHAADLPALLKSGFFSSRSRPLPISGPAAGGVFPGISEFLRDMLAPEHGAFRYLAGYLDGTRGLFRLQPLELDPNAQEPQRVLHSSELAVQAVGVHHGPVPAVGYLVTVGGRRIAFSGDQNASRPGFGRMIHGADLLVMAHAIPESSGWVERNLHAKPSDIGRLAAEAGVHRLLLSHLMARSLAHLDQNIAIIKARYSGPVTVAEDLMCLDVAAPERATP